MSVKIQQYTPAQRTVWENFIRQSNNGTLFHLQEFLDYHPTDRFTFHHLMFYDNDELVAVLPGGRRDSIFSSPTGASFGGFVIRPALHFEVMEQIVQRFLEYCRAQEIKTIRITPPMQIYNSVHDEVVEYALIYKKFACTTSLYSSAIDLSLVTGRESFGKSKRYETKKAENRGIEIVDSNSYRQAFDILVENKKKFQTTPTHSLKELIYLHEHFPKQIKLFLAVYEGKPIAGQWIFLTNQNCALIFYSMQLYEFRKLYALNLLLENVIKWCKNEGFHYLDYGVSPDTFHADPQEPSRSLVRFKESFGCTGCLRQTYTYSF